MQCLGAEYVVSEETTPRQREWRPQIYRKCTDTAWLFLFFLFWTGLMFIMGYSVVVGAAGRLLFGYDSFGNICGKKNSPVEGAPLSGQDMTLKTYMFFMNSCNPEIKDMRLSSTALCVSSCPEEQLSTLEEVQLFADTNGSFLCVYSLNSLNYTQSPNADSLCPRLPVPPSKSFPLFNRCVPQTPECYSMFASALINDADVLHQILSGIMSGRDTILGLCILALALSLAMMFAFRFITTLLVHIIISLVILGLLCHVNPPTLWAKVNIQAPTGFAVSRVCMKILGFGLQCCFSHHWVQFPSCSHPDPTCELSVVSYGGCIMTIPLTSA